MAIRRNKGNLVNSVALGVASYIVMQRSGPIISGSDINTIPALAACLLTVFSFRVLKSVLLGISDLFSTLKARTPTGHKGTGGLAKSLKELKGDLLNSRLGPYWGVFKGKPIFADFESNAAVIGTSGSGKTVGHVIPNILTILSSKFIVDFKRDLFDIVSPVLEARGEKCILLDLTGKDPRTAALNPLIVFTELFSDEGGLLDISFRLLSMTRQLSPDPKGGRTQNSYFDDGARTLIAFAILTIVLTKGSDGTLADVIQLLKDRKALLHYAQFATGRLQNDDGSQAEMSLHDAPWVQHHSAEDVESFFADYRIEAIDVAELLESENTRTADSFLTGARQALALFRAATPSHKVLSKTTFSFSELKDSDRIVNVFVQADASNIEAYKDALGLINWCMFQELQRSRNKKTPVYCILDECTNYFVEGLAKLLTWGRGYGTRILLSLQSLAAFASTYGHEALKTMLSETEIKLFLAGQREPETLKMLQAMVGDQSTIISGFRSSEQKRLLGVDGIDFREDGRPGKTADEIRRSPQALLFLRQNKAIETELPPYAAISPIRKLVGDNPFYGKPWLLPIKLNLNHLFRKVKRA
ncbi:MAG: type IV secretory system conjugative DNA transfer family protein [Pseudomonadota bacterium]